MTTAPPHATPHAPEDSARHAACQALLHDAGWGDATIAPLAGDASSRSYQRLNLKGKTAVLMDAPPAAESSNCPPGATPAEREALGYNAKARLAGGDLGAFIGLSDELHRRGFSAPEVFAADITHGFLLLEDLGDGLYARNIEAGGNEVELYAAAIDTLAAIRRSTFPQTMGRFGSTWTVMEYDKVARQAEADLLAEWYAPFKAGLVPGQDNLSDDALAEWRAAWDTLNPLIDGPIKAGEGTALNLRDVHAENLLWLPDRAGVSRVGLIDFQDALFGHPAYDLVSLLEDARRDVAPELAASMIDRYVDRACIGDRDAFARAYRLLGAQRNAKILGIFVRLAKRDAKPAYLDLIPRVAAHFVNDIAHPDLEPLKTWAQTHVPGVFEDAKP